MRFLFAPLLLTNPITDRAFQGSPTTPSDTVDSLDGPCQGLYVTGAGTVAVNLSASPAGTNTAVLTVAAGTIVRVHCTRVLATGTTATGLFALYDKVV